MKILILNSLKDRVVYSKKIIEMSERIKNSKLVKFDNCEHEIFMEKDIYRDSAWKEIDSFLKKIYNFSLILNFRYYIKS